MPDPEKPDQQLPANTVGAAVLLVRYLTAIPVEKLAFLIICGAFMWMVYSIFQGQTEREGANVRLWESQIALHRKNCTDEVHDLIQASSAERKDRIKAEADERTIVRDERAKEREERAQERADYVKWREMLLPLLKKAEPAEQSIAVAPLPKLKGMPRTRRRRRKSPYRCGAACRPRIGRDRCR